MTFMRPQVPDPVRVGFAYPDLFCARGHKRGFTPRIQKDHRPAAIRHRLDPYLFISIIGYPVTFDPRRILIHRDHIPVG